MPGGSLHAAIDEGDDLGSRAVVVGAEQAAADTAGDVVLLRPGDCRRVVSVRGHIGEGRIAADSGAAVGTPQEGDDLRAGAGGVGAEHGVAGALGDALLHGPQHRVIVVAASLHVGKGHGAGLGSGAAGSAPQEGDGLRAGAGGVGAEHGVAGALGDALLHGPDHGVLIVVASGNVDEGILAGGGRSLEHGLHGDLGIGHGEGILAVLLGQLDLLVLAVQNGEGIQHIALVGIDRQGDGGALGGGLVAGGHIAVLGALHGDGIGGDTAAATAGGGRLSEGNDHLDSGIVIVGGADGYGQGDGIASRAAGQSVGHLTGGIHRPAVNRHSAGRALGGALGIGQRPGVSGHTGSADGRLAAGHGVLLAVGDILQRRGGSLGDLKLGAGRNDQLIVVGQERSIVLEFQRTLLDFIGSHILARISCQLAIKGRGLAGYFAGVGVGQRRIGRAELLALAGVGRDGQRGRGDAGIGDGQLLGGCQRIVAGGDGSRGKGDGVCISNIGAVVHSGAGDGESIRTVEGGCLHAHGDAAVGIAVIDLGGGAAGLFQIAAVQHLGGDGQHSNLAADVGTVLVGGCYSVGARGLGQICCIQRAGMWQAGPMGKILRS